MGDANGLAKLAGMTDYERIARVIEYLDAEYSEQPDLTTLAGLVHLSPNHFQRLFSRWAGVSPKSFLQCLTHTHARRLLKEGRSVLDVALDVGLSGPGRLHDLCVTLEAASPGEVKSGGEGWTITAGFADSPFGICLVADGPRGVCHLTFVDSTDRDDGEAAIRIDWPRASIEWSDTAANRIVTPLFDESTTSRQFRAIVRGSDFQVRVWRALTNSR